MSKKGIGWAIGSIIVLGASGYALARFNTDSMAHVIYQQITHTSSSSSGTKETQKVKSDTKVTKNDTKKTQNTNLDKIQQTLSNKKFNGGYAVAENGSISQVKYLGNDTKQMNGKSFLATDTQNMLTTAAILQLIDQGKLKLTTPVNKFYDSLSVSNKITIQNLLDMTSGISNDSIPNNQLTNVLNWNIRHATIGTAGKYNYQEINYVLLEGIISQVTNQSYQNYITNTFLKPNDLNGIKFASSIDNNELATPYNGSQAVSNTDLAKATNEQMGQNELVAAPNDLLKLTQILVKNYGNNPEFISNQPTGRLMKDGDIFYVSGGIVGYRTSIAISKDGKKGVILMSNNSNGKDNLTSVVKEVYNQLN